MATISILSIFGTFKNFFTCYSCITHSSLAKNIHYMSTFILNPSFFVYEFRIIVSIFQMKFSINLRFLICWSKKINVFDHATIFFITDTRHSIIERRFFLWLFPFHYCFLSPFPSPLFSCLLLCSITPFKLISYLTLKSGLGHQSTFSIEQ